MRIIRVLKIWIIRITNFVLDSLIPKNEKRVLLYSSAKIEENALVMANYLSDHYDYDFYFMCPEDLVNHAESFLRSEIKVIRNANLRFNPKLWHSLYILYSSKFVFYTHPSHYKLNKKHLTINLWHGVGHKKIQTARDPKNKFETNITIATSPMTRKMFADLFGVSKGRVLITGQPRNDLMLISHTNAHRIKNERLKDLSNFSQIIIWMPTFRRSEKGEGGHSKIDSIVDNIYNITNFDIEKFNQILEANNTVCLVKSHYFITQNKTDSSNNNIIMINDNWIYERNLLLYELLACTDALITDYSSVMIDYSLLDQPIFCIAEDLEEYKRSQGLYFDDYENWVPAKLHQNQNSFMEDIENFLAKGIDAEVIKRRDIRDKYYEHIDFYASERIAKNIFNDFAKKL